MSGSRFVDIELQTPVSTEPEIGGKWGSPGRVDGVRVSLGPGVEVHTQTTTHRWSGATVLRDASLGEATLLLIQDRLPHFHPRH